MNGFEINKIIAAIIFTVLVVFGIDKVTDLIFYVEKPKEAAYVVEAPVAKTAVSTAGSDGLNIKDFLALGDIEHGKAVFKKCTACHVVAKGGKNKIGPVLYGVLGRKSGAISDYNRAIEIDPDDPYAYIFYGYAKQNLGDMDGACSAWRIGRRKDTKMIFKMDSLLSRFCTNQ